ncbi:hypothetical protein PENTCL1PPCAC_20097 [Pristionchus entomophagus]|uniref:FACT complex subunit n=1 Tax=Pristionchus entomophagus TaxID=358040 RepID=A0AAV5TUN6_9BILA|nr:hypothetical protein PENTCL1PPCAC_20097 [Pristionchus entomophagus]
MSAPTLNPEVFKKRLRKLYELWNKEADGLGSVESFAVLVGRDSNARPYSKSKAFQIWLYTCELDDTLAVATKDKLVILGSGKKAAFFDSVVGEAGDGLPAIEVIHRNKANKDSDNFAQLIGMITKQEIGCFEKDKFKNDFVDSWEAALKGAGVKKVDMSESFTKLFAVKDSDEVTLIKNAANVSVNSWGKIKGDVVELIDKERKKKMSDLAGRVDASMSDEKVQGNIAKQKNIDNCYDTIMQSGGSYSFKWSTSTSDEMIHFGAITTSLGAKFENYCSNLARTLLVQPSKELEEAYESVLAAELKLIESLKPGTRLKDAYEAAVNTLKPELREKLYKKELGFLTGIEFREGSFIISADSECVVKAGMVFIVSIGVAPLGKKDPKKNTKEAAVLISDTILVHGEGKPNEILTEKAKSRLKSNMVRIKENEEKEEEEPRRRSDNKNQEEMGRGKRSVVLSEQTRNKTTNEEKRKEHQKDLLESLNEAAKERMEGKIGNGEQKKSKKSNVSYKSIEKFPTDSDVRNLSVYVDKKHGSVILPIFGVPVPFHISMIKNCSQSVEGDYTYLRVNFTHPGSQMGKDNANFPNPLAEYLKEVTYRASNMKEPGEIHASSNNLTTAFRLIKEMQKSFRTEEAEEREKEGAVKQDKLILSLNKANPKMKDLYVRPNIIAKKISGSLEAHTNGFRYTSLRGDKIDVLYNNVKHAFYQPCDNEMLILLHFHLKHPVLWGKKKYQDIQFYTEVGEVTTDLGKYHHMQDRDDIQSEQMEREMRRKLNEAFKSFTTKVEKMTNEALDFDSPFNELGFMGTPHRSNCILKPTSSCLINLTEWPPFVVTLEEVELVHFERVSLQLKNFDMVFVFKDYSRKTQMITAIPMNTLEPTKEWLNSCDILYTEGQQSLNWPKIMKHILDDTEEFFQEGGWNFLGGDSDPEMEDENSSDEEGYSPGSSGSESDSDEDESEGEETGSEDGDSEDDGLDSDESSGKDWSDLEEEAARDDKRKERDEFEKGGDRDRDRDRDRKRRDHHHKGGPPHKKRR